jgi:chromosome segregation ATPase
VAAERDKALSDKAASDRSLALIEQECARLRSRNDQLQGQLSALRGAEMDSSAASGELAQVREQLGAVTAERNTAREDHARATRELEDARKELQRARERISELETRLAEAEKADTADARKVQAALEKEREDLRITEAARQAMEKELNELRSLSEEMNRSNRAEAEAAMGRLHELERELSSASEALKERDDARAEVVRLGAVVANAEIAAEKAREEVRELHARLATANEQRHSVEKALIEARARLESEHDVRAEQSQRIRRLEDDIERERKQLDDSAPRTALETLSAQLTAERAKWEARFGEAQKEAEALQQRLAEAELRESELASQLEAVELSRQDVQRAKALAGQRRAQIERMQADVESARRQARDAEDYWKGETLAFQKEVAAHLEAAEAGEEGADARMVKLLERLKVGLADRNAKLRRRNNRVEKELTELRDRVTAFERILLKRQEEESRLRKLIAELERPATRTTKKGAKTNAKGATRKAAGKSPRKKAK